VSALIEDARDRAEYLSTDGPIDRLSEDRAGSGIGGQERFDIGV
jgi:hypothetical protein